MLLLMVASFDNPCLQSSGTVRIQQSENQSNVFSESNSSGFALNNTIAALSEPVGSRYTIAAASLLLWFGTLQVFFNWIRMAK